MKKFLLILSTILTLTLIILGSTLVISATEPATSGECGAEGSSLTWSFNAETGVLSIEGEGAMLDYYNNYTESGGPWCVFADSITSISIGDKVSYIGNNAFL